MNEMNNQGNEFNNQNLNYENEKLNYENNNYGENNYNQFNQEQGNNINYQNNNQKEEKSKKSYCGLLVVFMVISLLLTGYIVYDKVIKKEEVKLDEKQQQDEYSMHELIKFDNNQITKKENITENGVNYFEIVTIKNAKLVVDIKLFTEKDKSGSEDENGYDDQVKMDLYINGTKRDSLVLQTYFRCNILDCEVMDQYHFDDIKTQWDENIKKLVGTIKGDKYYLYLSFERDNSSIYIINEDGKILDTSGLKFYGGAYGSVNESMELSKSCKIYQYAKPNSDNIMLGTHFIREDAIYYLKFSKNYDENSLANEYKVTISNDKVIIEKIGSCQVSAFGQKIWDEIYYDNN